jgi:hypothetical protein
MLGSGRQKEMFRTTWMTGGARFAAELENLHNEKLRRAARLTPACRLNEIAELSTTFDTHLSNFSAPQPRKQQSSRQPVRCDNISAVRHLATSFKAMGLDCVVGGSIAAMMFVLPRVTTNINLNIRIAGNTDVVPTADQFKIIAGAVDDVDPDTYRYWATSEPAKSTFMCRRWPVEVHFSDGDVGTRVFSRPLVVSDISFAPPECLCVWKMLSLPRSRCYHKDRGDVVGILGAVSKIDYAWVRRQLIAHDAGEGAKVREWDDLYWRWFLRRTQESEPPV